VFDKTALTMDIHITDRSHVFNNAGALMMGAGNVQVALDLFRGALESKLSYERSLHSAMGAVQRCVTPDCVAAAENHLTDMDSLLVSSIGESDDEGSIEQEIHTTSYADSQEQASTTTISVSSPPDSGWRQDHTVVPEESRGYNPYLYKSPFQLTAASRTSSEETSAIIIFNLGLVHHIEWRNSPKAAAFYEISAALLAGQQMSSQTSLLKVALLNNFGVWCYDNGDGESLRTCVEHLSTLIEATPPVHLSNEVAEGIRANIRWLLTPPNGASPAA